MHDTLPSSHESQHPAAAPWSVDLSSQVESLDHTLTGLEHLEKDAYIAQHRDELQNEIRSHIDLSDGIDETEESWLHIAENFFDDFLDEWGIDDVDDDTKKSLIQWIQAHGYTIANLDGLTKSLHHQSSKIEGKSPQEKKSLVHLLLQWAMGGYMLDQLDHPWDEIAIHEQMAMLMQLQSYHDALDDEEKERKRKLRELLLAELFEWKNLEIYEVVIDAMWRVIITLKDPHGEIVTLSYDPQNGDISRIDAGSAEEIIPASQTQIALVIQRVRDQQRLPYDPEDTGTLLQFVQDKL